MGQQKSQNRFRLFQWRMLLITMFCYLFFYTGRHNFGWAAAPMAQDLGVSFEKIGWISFSMLIGYAIGQFINGNLADRFNPRIMITVGGLMSVLTNVAISFAESYAMVAVLWTVNGYFQSMAWAPGSKLIANWWPAKERGMAFGFYTMAAASSSAFTYFLSIILIQQQQSWQMLFRIPVLFLLLAVVIFYLVARAKPSDLGFENLMPAHASSATRNWQNRYAAVLGNKPFLTACIAIGFQSMARYALIFWVPVYFLGDTGKNDSIQIWISLLLPVGMAIGALTFGRISDSVFKGNRPPAIAMGMFSCAAISLLIFLLPKELDVVSGLFIFAAGFFAYGPQANFWPICPELLGENLAGTGIGIMNMTAYLFAALGEPVLGKVIDTTGNTAMIFVAVAIIAAISGTVVLFVKKSKYIQSNASN
jgi:MFS transporter, OPA family, glycerol-3-phosphate transporter